MGPLVVGEAQVGRNVNVGIMGHVDAGKTALARALSSTASTAAFDKNPQSAERGITLDLGFSSLHLPPPVDRQVTLVDCPGHASLFRAVIGAAAIIDAVILVVDGRAGFQVQTAECLVLAEIVTDRLLVALSKIDLLIGGEEQVARAIARIRAILAKTRFADAPIVPFSPHLAPTKEALVQALGVLLRPCIRPSQLATAAPLISADHCFSLRGQAGIIMTGTVLAGTVAVGDQLEVLPMNGSRIPLRIRSIQSFRRDLESAAAGDRIGLQMVPIRGGSADAATLERVVLAAPGTLKSVAHLVLPITPIPHYRLPLRSGAKFHVSILHQTAIATVTFGRQAFRSAAMLELEFLPELPPPSPESEPPQPCWAVLRFDSVRVFAPPQQLVLFSRLDADVRGRACRLAMHGRVETTLPGSVSLFRWRERRGKIDRLKDPRTLIGRELARTAVGLSTLFGTACTVLDDAGRVQAEGVIGGAFGASGKFIVTLSSPLDGVHASWAICVRQKIPIENVPGNTVD